MRGRSLAAAASLIAAALAGMGTPSPASAAACDVQIVSNGGFESGSTGWAATSGVLSASGTSQASHSGSRLAWLDGYGTSHTDTLSQSVTLPSGCQSASLTYWLHVDTAETAATARDTLTVRLGGTTVATYSNLDKASGYIQRTVDASALVGQTATLTFTGVENSSLQTSFTVDDVALTTSGGNGGQDPAVTNPGAQTATVGVATALQIHASDPAGLALTYTAAGLPAGLAIASASGLVSGTPTTAGTSTVTVTATNTAGRGASAQFSYTVSPASPGEGTRTPANPAYTVNLTSDAAGFTWTGHQSVSFTNASATALPEVYLRLWDNYHGSCPSTPITVSNVTGGTASALSVNCTAMKITLPSPLGQGQSGTIAFDLSIVVPSGTDRFGHDGAYSFIGNALPVLAVRDVKGWHLDPYTNNGESFYSLASDFTVTLDHPTALAVPATGTSVDTPGSSGRTVTRATATKVRDFAWAAGAFPKITGTTAGGVTVNVYRVSSITAAQAQSMLTVATSALDAHAGRLGAYPYGEADVVLDNNFWFGGMEYPGFVLDLVSKTALAHELAHQWFYGIVGDDEYSDPWLDEGFTDYMTDLYNGVTGAGCALNWASTAERLTNSMAYWDAHSNRYSTVIYGYGKCTLHDLRRLIGDTAMTTLLRTYAQSHWYGVSTVADFKAAAQQAAGTTSLTSFWTQHRVDG